MAKKKSSARDGKKVSTRRPRKHIYGSVKASVSLPAEVVEWVAQSGMSLSGALAHCVRASREFRQWWQEQDRK